MALSMILFLSGCGQSVERVYTSPYPEAYSIAVVPFRNLSGSEDLDIMAVTDELYAELQQVKGQLHVMPVNRVLAALSDLGMQNVESPDEVILLAETLDVEGVIVGTVTRYDPYPPPQMGMTLQMYLRDDKVIEGRSLVNINPAEISKAASPMELPAGAPIKPRAMVVRIFDAGNEETRRRIQEFSRQRGAKDSPYTWRIWTTRRNYIRFVCHEMTGELLAREKERIE